MSAQAKAAAPKKTASPKKAAAPKRLPAPKDVAAGPAPKKKTATAPKNAAAPKKTAAKKHAAAPKKTAAPKNAAGPKRTAATKNAPEPKKTAAPKDGAATQETAAPKKAAAPKTLPAPKGDLPVLLFEDQRAFDKWLSKNQDGPGCWVQFAKKGSGLVSIDYQQAVDVALIWGFIDGQSKGGDPYYLQRFTPRGAKSLWSKINREKIARLEAEGRMQPRGAAEVARAKADGRWDAAYDPPSRATVPDDLAAALAANPAAAAAFAKLDSQNRYAILWRLQTAKRAVTRTRNLEKLVAMLAEGRRVHPDRKKATPAVD